jgi:ribonuclease HIII
VDDVARRLFREQGLEGLAKVAKMHFKTTLKAQGRSA